MNIPWEGGKLVEESDTPVLGELITPNNSRIPRRSQGIADGGSWVAFMVVLERREVGKERNSEGVCSVQGGYTRKNWIVQFLKPDSPIFPG
jgi:hypothetical protein